MNKIATVDLETDPFEHGQMIYPFVLGFYDGTNFSSYWKTDCVESFINWLRKQDEPLTIYAHNGGRFDYFYFLPFLERDLRIVNGRIIQCWIGKHELRDSFAIMPFALETYRKTPIDYSTFVPGVREKHRETILSYLRDDCVDLYTLCDTFHQEFGDKLTIGSASMAQLKRFHKFRSGDETYDKRLREYFYFGGRNQVFKAGIIRDDIKIIDVNSMYPHVMKNYLHPISTGIHIDRRINSMTSYLCVEGHNLGAFPVRTKEGSLDFTSERGTYYISIHEFNAAEDTGSFRCNRIIKTYGWSERQPFDKFVDHFFTARTLAKQNGDKIRTIFYKFVLNSAYGKFAQNPENYAEWTITSTDALPEPWHQCSPSCTSPCTLRWTPTYICGEYTLWSRPTKERTYFNIATGASITGAARAVLLRGIHSSTRPYYCDTDSIICHDFRGPISEYDLGAWKIEATGNMLAICGKKLYAVYDASGACIKKAHKGARLTGQDILRIARGATVEYANPVPAFKLDGTWTFTKRTIRRTAA